MNDKAELLDQLTIDRSASDRSGWSPLLSLGLAAVCAVLGGFIALKFFAPTAAAPAAVASDKAPASAATKTASKPPAASTRASTTTSAAAKRDADDRVLNASGYITARRIATVSSQISGLITEVNVEEGMRVEEGQILARLDSALAEVNLQLANAQQDARRASQEGIEANLAEAKRVLARANELKAKKLVSDANVTAAQASVDALVAQLNNAKANFAVSQKEIERQQERLSDHIVRAPFSGVVTVKNAQTGEIVSPGSAGGGFTRTGICTIVDMDSLEIEVDVNEAFIGRVSAGQKVEANLDAYPDWNIPARVIAIIPTADRAKATVRVRIEIEVKDVRILPDMGVKVAFLRTSATA